MDFTLDSIRDSYRFDGSCQGSVPQAIVAFLESEDFEDAIRNVISIGGDCDTTGAITGSIAWIYYIGYNNWVSDWLPPSLRSLRNGRRDIFRKSSFSWRKNSARCADTGRECITVQVSAPLY